jgi:hypothetical protein
VSPPDLREVYAEGLLFWDQLCPACAASFKAWQCAPNPGAWTRPKVQENPQLLAWLASMRVTGPSPQEWRDTISHQLLLIRKICTRHHNPENLSYAYEETGFPPQIVGTPC